MCGAHLCTTRAKASITSPFSSRSSRTKSACLQQKKTTPLLNLPKDAEQLSCQADKPWLNFLQCMSDISDTYKDIRGFGNALHGTYSACKEEEAEQGTQPGQTLKGVWGRVTKYRVEGGWGCPGADHRQEGGGEEGGRRGGGVWSSRVACAMSQIQRALLMESRFQAMSHALHASSCF